MTNRDSPVPKIKMAGPYRRDALVASAAPRWTIHYSSAGVTGTPLRLSEKTLVRSALRRDALVASDTRRWISHPTSAGTTSVPLRYKHDKRAPPMRAQHACPSICFLSDLRIRQTTRNGHYQQRNQRHFKCSNIDHPHSLFDFLL